MSLPLLSRRAAAARSFQPVSVPVQARAFSTPVNDAFSPVAPTGQAPPPPPSFVGSDQTSAVLRDAVNATAPRYDWTREEIRELYNTPLMELAFQSVSPSRAG